MMESVEKSNSINANTQYTSTNIQTIPNTQDQIHNPEEFEKKKPFNLESRTLAFSKDIIGICNKIRKNTVNLELTKQLIRSAASVGANYREANEALSKKDLLLRLKIARKEAKETSYWLELLMGSCPELKKPLYESLCESKQLRCILTSIIEKS